MKNRMNSFIPFIIAVALLIGSVTDAISSSGDTHIVTNVYYVYEEGTGKYIGSYQETFTYTDEGFYGRDYHEYNYFIQGATLIKADGGAFGGNKYLFLKTGGWYTKRDGRVHRVQFSKRGPWCYTTMVYKGFASLDIWRFAYYQNWYKNYDEYNKKWDWYIHGIF